MKVLVTGCNGMLGNALMRELMDGHEPEGADLPEWDITDRGRVAELIELIKPGAVINAAAFTRVDECEEKEDHANRVNGDAAGFLAGECGDKGIPFFHVSTDYIFDGSKEGPYLEEDPPNPISAYGRSKLLGETLVADNTDDFCIMRTSWLFGEKGPNFVRSMVSLYDGGREELRIVNDERGRPTYARDLAHALRLALDKGLRGIYHFCNGRPVSWYEFAQEIFNELGKGPRLLPIKADEFGRAAKRPMNSVLSTDKYERAIGGPVRDHAEALQDYLVAEGWLGKHAKD